MTARKKKRGTKKSSEQRDQATIETRPGQNQDQSPNQIQEQKNQENQTTRQTQAKKERVKKQPKTRPIDRPKQTRDKEQFDPLHQVAFWGLALLLFFPPYFRGLFFAPDQQKALIFATLVFWLTFLWRWLNRDHKFMRGPLDWFALALPVVYIISSFTAVNKGLAINEIVKNILYFMTYWSVSRLVRNQEDVHKLLHVIYVSAIGVAVAGLATATGIIHINDGFLNERIYSTFQYPNALASYLGVVSLLGFYLWQRSRDYTVGTNLAGRNAGLSEWLANSNPWAYLYTCGNFLLLAVLIGTKSRGGLLIFTLLFVIYLIFLNARHRLTNTLHAGVTGGLALVCVTKFIPLAVENQHNQAWGWIFAGLALSFAWQVLLRQLIEKFIIVKWESRQFNLTFGALAGITIVAAVIIMRNVGDIWEKVVAFLQVRSAITRMDFINDAIEMFMQKPLLGWGGGGWKEAYRSFQDYLYSSNEVHSYYFQVGVETGLLGLLVVAGIWLSFMFYCLRFYRQRQNDPAAYQFSWLMMTCFLIIAGHALIDFDLSLSALTMVLWTFFGFIAVAFRLEENNAEQPTTLPKRNPGHIPAAVPLVLVSTIALLIIIPAFILSQSHANARHASAFFQT
ncbi:MAG: O-antigen ligase family protein, partial [Firmicutes bacterium]|nr:O-antigen ligase family protein [Bacillota bacterium]